MKLSRLHIIHTLLATALLGACSTEKPVDKPDPAPAGPQIPIKFGTSIDTPDSRGVSLSALPNNSQFPVYAYHMPSPDGGTTPGSISDLMTGVTNQNITNANYDNYLSGYSQPIAVSHNAGVCTYFPTKIWPQATNDRLMFFAMYDPASSNPFIYHSAIWDTRFIFYPNFPMLDFGIQYSYNNNTPDPSQLTDLLSAATGPLYRTTAALKFKHVKTRITFSAKLGYPSSDPVKITRIALRNVNTAGTYLLTALHPEGYWDSYMHNPVDYLFTTDNGRLVDVALNDATFTPMLTASAGELMLIPQPLDPIVLEVFFTVFKPNDTYSYEKNFFVLPVNTPWEAGKSIDYQLYVARDAINIGATVTIWQLNGTTINVPITN